MTTLSSKTQHDLDNLNILTELQFGWWYNEGMIGCSKDRNKLMCLKHLSQCLAIGKHSQVSVGTSETREAEMALWNLESFIDLTWVFVSTGYHLP